MWLHQLKGSFYALFFIIVNLVYLIIELSFNARILDVSSSLPPDMDYGQLELYGRTISAAGATILAWRLLVPFRQGLSLLRLVLKFSLIALIVFPLVFVGQKKLIDALVDSSSAETRRSAEILTLLKYGIANGFVEIDELALDELTLQMAEGKMFITLSGLLAYNATAMREVLEQRLERIAGYAIATQQRRDSERLYRHYLYARDQVIEAYEGYQVLVNELEQSQSGSLDEAITLYETAMNRAMRNWQDYQQALADNPDLELVEPAQLAALQSLFAKAESAINSCSNNSCYTRGTAQLQFDLSRLLRFYTTLDDWCHEVLDAQRGVLLQCLTKEADMRDIIVRQRQSTLAAQAGLSQPYADKFDYLNSADMRSSVFAALKEAGIAIDPHWEFSAYERLLSDISAQLKARYRLFYNSQVQNQFSAVLSPRSDLARFNAIAGMQAFYRQALDNQEISAVKHDLSQQAFEQEYIAPLYLARFNALLSKLKSAPDWYAVDAPYEESGKDSLRNLVVPAVAIVFSLIFALLNSINLVLNFVFLLIEEKLWLRWLGFVALLGVVVWWPLQQQYTIYDQAAYSDLLTETERKYTYSAHLLDWVARTEPVIYPLGNMLRYNFLNGFEFD